MEERIRLLKELLNQIKNTNVTKIYEIFELLDKTKDNELQKENNIYLYLLSFITEVPSKYQERIRSIKSDNILLTINNQRYKEINVQNQIRMNIFRSKFHETKELIEKDINAEFKNNIEKELLLLLVNLANQEEIKIRKKLEYMIKNKEYSNAYNYLEKRNSIRKLNLYESYIYVLCATIIRITKTNKIPKVLNQNPTNMKSAIMGYNFKMALSFNNEDIATKYEDSKVIINLLLLEINKLTDNILKEAKDKIEQEQINTINKLKKIKEELNKGNIEIALELIKQYLKEKNKEEHLYLIENLIKVYLLSNDTSYKYILDLLNNPNYRFDIKYFYSEFHNSINRNAFDIASIHLDIIKYYQPQYKEEFSDKELEKIITMLEYNKEEEQFLLSELSKLKEDNEIIGIFKKIPHKRRKILIRISNKIQGLSASSTGIKEPKNLVLRRVDENLKTGNEKELLDKALKMYINKEYNLAVLLYMRLLTSMDYISIQVCEMIGLSFLHLNEKQEGLKYLKLSKQFVKSFQANKNGIDKLIDLLEKAETEETKEKINEFITKYDNEIVNFDMEKLEAIADYMKENNMTIEEGIEKFELVLSQALIIKLIFAKYYYMEGMIISGDKLLQEVEQTKPKTNAVHTMLKEIRANKQLYQSKKRKLHL